MKKEIYHFGSDIAVLFFVVGSILLYLGGLYGNVNPSTMLIISGIIMKLYSVFLIWTYMIRNSKIGGKQ